MNRKKKVSHLVSSVYGLWSMVCVIMRMEVNCMAVRSPLVRVSHRDSNRPQSYHCSAPAHYKSRKAPDPAFHICHPSSPALLLIALPPPLPGHHLQPRPVGPASGAVAGPRGRPGRVPHHTQTHDGGPGRCSSAVCSQVPNRYKPRDSWDCIWVVTSTATQQCHRFMNSTIGPTV